MTPVYQTHFSRDGDKGNCWQACLASLMQCLISEVPDARYSSDGTWFDITNEWLKSKGFELVTIGGRRKLPDGGFASYDAPPGWAIACGQSPRGQWGHAIVVWDGKMIHDPHPEGIGIKGFPDTYYQIIPLS